MKTAVAILVPAVAMLILAVAQQQECVSKLAGCVEFINGTKPTAACCDSIKEAVEKELACLCSLYNTPGLLSSFGISLQQALNLTTNCGVPVTLDRCPTTTTSALSPAATTPPPPPPGLDKGSSDRTTIADVFTIFLLFYVSSLFY